MEGALDLLVFICFIEYGSKSPAKSRALFGVHLQKTGSLLQLSQNLKKVFCACKVSLEKSYMFYKRHVPCCLQGERRIDMMQDEQIVELYFKRDERALVETSVNICKLESHQLHA